MKATNAMTGRSVGSTAWMRLAATLWSVGVACAPEAGETEATRGDTSQASGTEGASTDGSGRATDTDAPPCTDDDPPEVPATLSLEPVAVVEVTRVLERETLLGLRDQTTARGRGIADLHAFRGGLYLAYGDYSNNTGPIEVVRYEADGTVRSEGVLETEEVLAFQTLGDRLVTPNIDPRGHEAEGGVFVRAACARWSPSRPIAGAVHVYDVVAKDGVWYAATGSLTDAPALVVRSEDEGRSWAVEYAHAPPAGQFARFLELGVTSDAIVATGVELGTSPRAVAVRQDAAGVWHELSGVPTGGTLVPLTIDTRPEVRFVHLTGDLGKVSSASGTYALEGDTVVAERFVPEGHRLIAWENVSHEEGLVLVAVARDAAGNDHVWVTQDHTTWTDLWTLPAPPRGRVTSVGVLGDRVYLGTDEGDVLRVDPR